LDIKPTFVTQPQKLGDYASQPAGTKSALTSRDAIIGP